MSCQRDAFKKASSYQQLNCAGQTKGFDSTFDDLVKSHEFNEAEIEQGAEAPCLILFTILV